MDAATIDVFVLGPDPLVEGVVRLAAAAAQGIGDVTVVAAAELDMSTRVVPSIVVVDLTGSDFALIPDSLVDHVYRLVEELVSNSVRHAHADFIWVEVRRWRHDVVVSVEDDGRGFAFHGRYDLPMLERKHIGPASVKERVGLLHGQMVLNSRRTGSRIEVRLPMQRTTKRSSSTSRASRRACRGLLQLN